MENTLSAFGGMVGMISISAFIIYFRIRQSPYVSLALAFAFSMVGILAMAAPEMSKTLAACNLVLVGAAAAITFAAVQAQRKLSDEDSTETQSETTNQRGGRYAFIRWILYFASPFVVLGLIPSHQSSRFLFKVLAVASLSVIMFLEAYFASVIRKRA